MSDHQRDDWADKLALLLARQRTGGDVHMDGSNDPTPTERAAARRFMGDLAAAGFRRSAPNPDELLDLLDRAQQALRAVGKAAIVVKPTLDKPYPDAPEQTPWSRFMDRPSRRAYNLGIEINQKLKGLR